MRMKFSYFFIVIAVIIGSTDGYSQSLNSGKKIKTFSRIQLNYGLGINEFLNHQKLNPFQIKMTFGKQSERFGVGLGIATANFRNRDANGGINLNTVAFSLNTHYTFADFSDKDNKFFIRAGAGYAPRIFRDYAKGFLYDGSFGYVITNKKGAKYFVEAQYQMHHFGDFTGWTDKEVESVGLGIGVWF